MQKKRLGQKRKRGKVDMGKPMRYTTNFYCFQSHGEMSNRRFRNDERLRLGALHYVTHNNTPFLWDQVREVPVLYHITRTTTFHVV
ncbi:hypothetical protein DFH94DRAFT_757652 [Russula ochroleuca]|uniref:PRO8NT domain-containing protein n=1 Tax=Russula ochroleuca TaxID=152965 RepID=A0A9P5MSE4_9AGAM|nr:hypothetical protein DFH94DRAFT_757652 [Russula ochroleuca]